MSKRVLALILTFSMVFTMLNSAFAADISGTRQRSGNTQLPAVYAASPSDFTDLPDDWSRGAIERAIQNGLLSGANGKINAGAQLTRAELAAIVVRAFGTTETASLSGFSDVNPSDWYYDALQKAVAMGILSGNNGKLNPNAPITREEVCAVLHRAFLLQDGGNAAQKFGDAARISDWAQAAVAAMAAKGYIAGDSAGNVNGSKTITRAEFAQMMDNLVKGYPSNAQGGVIEGNAVMKAGQSLSGMTIKGDLILADGLGRNDVDLSNCIVEGRVIVRGGNVITLSGTTRAGGVVAAASMGLTNNTGSKIDNISVVSDFATITLSGAAGKVEILADNVTIRAESGAKVDIIETAASGTTIEGSGAVAAVTVKPGASNTTVTTNHTNITVENGGGMVHSNNGSLSAGESGTTDNKGALKADNKAQATTNSSSSGSSGNRRPNTGGSSGGGSSSTTRYTVAAANGQTIGTFERGTILTVDLNGGGDNYTVTVSGSTLIATPVRAGYTFNGWLVKGTTITAQWTESGSNPALIEVRDSEGRPIGAYAAGTQLTVDPANEKDEPYTFTVEAGNNIITVPTREGYLFNRWLPVDHTVTADWRKKPSEMTPVMRDDGEIIGEFEIGVTLTIQPNNGEDSYTVVVAPGLVIRTPVKEGFYFVSWYRDPLTTLTAQWSETPVEVGSVECSEGRHIGNYPIGTVLTVDPDNGEEPYTVTVEKQTVIPHPAKEGYDFDRWEPIGHNIKAVWIKKQAQMTEVKCSDGHTVGNFEIGVTLTIDPANGKDEAYKVIVKPGLVIQHPVREGYTFHDWNRNPLTTLTAIWKKNAPGEVVVKDSAGREIGTFKVGDVLTVNYDNGTKAESVTVAEGTVITAPAKDGYTFKEWMVSGKNVTAIWTENEPVTGDISLVKGNTAAKIYISEADPNYDGISLIAEAAAGDIEAVTGKRPEVVTTEPESGVMIVAGTVGADIIAAEGLTWAIAPSEGYTSANWERYQIQVKRDGGKTKVVVAGADKRGVIYGLFHITQDLCGVSPWIYWGDVAPEKKSELTFTAAQLETISEKPTVGYRGIFLNDEAPSLTGFVQNQFGNYNYLFYANVYELILRLKGNYLWPAMWSNNFSEDGILNIGSAKDTRNAEKLAAEERTIYANAILADHYGVVMGTSHHEPLYRAGVEWQNLQSGSNPKYTFETQQGAAKNEWNYFLNNLNIDAFWDDGVKRNQDYESVITIGMRGEADSALTHPDGTKLTLQENIQVLKNAITSQKNILNKYSLSEEPQLLVLYKEVEDFWYGKSGEETALDSLNKWDVLDDTIIMLCEDNQGNLRTLPRAEERNRPWGMYYHFDYHGSPRSYEWINTIPLARVWDNMTMTYDYGVDDIWIVNVGDLKPMELPISYFLDMAYDFSAWGSANPNSSRDYTRQWVEQQFGKSGLSGSDLEDMTDVLVGYTDMNGRHKPEIVFGTTYSTTNYNEAQRMLAEAYALEEKAAALLEKMPADYKDAYWQLVYYPAAATANINIMQISHGLNELYAKRGSAAANAYADIVNERIQRDKDLTAYYNNTMSNGYWHKMMSSNHVGYTSWNDSGWSYPTPTYVSLANGSAMLVDVEGTEEAVSSGTLTLPDFTDKGQECYALTITNGGDEQLTYDVSVSADWIQVPTGNGSLYTMKVLPVSVDWSKISGDSTGTITVSSGGRSVTVAVNAKALDVSGLAEKTFVMSNGVISMEASSYSGSGAAADGTAWKTLTDYGKTKDTMKTYPSTRFFEGGNGPWLEYTVRVPQEGEYTLTAYVGPSNNLYSDTRLKYGVSIDNGTVTVKDTLPDNFVSGSGNAWSASVMAMGRTAQTTHNLSAGVHKIRIYGVDAGLQLEKLVLSANAIRTSYMGPQESYYVGKTIAQQPLVCHQVNETMSIPGVIRAADCTENVSVSGTALSAKAGETYTYPVSVQAGASYAVSIKAGASSGTTATISVGGKSVTVALSDGMQYVAAEDLLALSAGAQTLTLTVSGDAEVEEMLIESFDTSPGTLVTINASSNTDNVSNIFDQKRATVWKPETSDSAPYVVFDFGQKTYFDWFKMSGTLSSVSGYKISVSNNGTDWTEAYAGTTLTNGAKQYIHGNKPCVGTKVKFEFTVANGTFEISELQLNTYTNWALEDKATSVSVEANGGNPNAMIDGDRIGSDGNDGWIAAGANGKSTTLTFGSPRTLDGIYVLGFNRDSNSQFIGNVIPDESTVSDAVSNGYTISYLENGEWKDIATHAPAGKVLSYIEFNEPITTTAVKVKVSTSYWIRIMEIEPIQKLNYKLGGTAAAPTVSLGDIANLDILTTDAAKEVTVTASTGGETVSIQASSSNTSAATVAVNDGALTVTPIADGTATITVTASATGYQDAMTVFTVNVRTNWALGKKEGKVTSYTSTDSSTTKDCSKLIDGDRRSDGDSASGNKQRVDWNKPGEGIYQYVEIELKQSIKFEKFVVVGQQAQTENKLAEPTADSLGFKIAPAVVEYWNGAKWLEAGTLAAMGSGEKANNILREFTDFDDVISNKIRLKYDNNFGDNRIRLIELEAYGTPASMPEPEDDPTEGLTNFALKSHGGTVTASAGEGTTADAEISKLNDRVLASSNSNRWRTNTFPAYVDITLNETKTISVVDVIGQGNTENKVPKFDESAKSGLKNLQIQVWQNDAWTTVATGDSTVKAAIRYQFDAVTTNKVRINMPDSNCGVDGGYARFIEVQVWGEDSTGSKSTEPEVVRLDPLNVEVGQEYKISDLFNAAELLAEETETAYSAEVISSDSDVVIAELSEDGTLVIIGVNEGNAEITIELTSDGEDVTKIVIPVTVTAASETEDDSEEQENEGNADSFDFDNAPTEEEETPSEQKNSPTEDSLEEE